VSIRPWSSSAHNNLGAVLKDRGKPDEAIGEFRRAIALKPDNPQPHNNLGVILKNQGKLREAINEYHRAIALRPDYAFAHNNLGTVLKAQGKLDEAIAEYRRAIALRPDYANAHGNLGMVLNVQGRLDEAVAEYRTAIRLRPEWAAVHANLGAVLIDQGKPDKAIAEWRTAIRIQPNIAEPHANLGLALRSRGDYTEAIAELSKARDLGKSNPRFVQQVEAELTTTQRQADLAPRLAGDSKPADAAEMLGFAQLCYEKKLHGTSARFWADAFKAQPALADDMQAQNRYSAACAAARAGSGQGKDNPPLVEATRTRWRKQAIEWLKADLASWTRRVEAGPPRARQPVIQTFQHWRTDPDLAGLRDQTEVAKLPEAEQKTCREFWVELDKLDKKASEKKATPH
jgi:tetratricopeptide (TPR) repeat protein